MNKKINCLVTGGDGFIGSHLVEMLIKKNYNVTALCQYNAMNSWGWLDDLSCQDYVRIRSGDIRDPYFCKVITKNIDIIFHLAALISIPYSYISPDSYVKTNINGTFNICQAAKENNCSRIINTSTSEVYGTAKYVPIDEKHPLQAQSPYSASKIAADAIAMSYFNSYDLPITIARPFNTYGPRQSARAIIPTIITQIASNKKTIKLGDLSPTRDFNYVEDTCRGLISIAEANQTIGKTINIGSNSEISIGSTFKLIKKLMNSNIKIVNDKQRIRPRKSEVFRLWADNSKIKEITGYEPKINFTEGLEKTINWVLKPKNLNFYKSDLYNV